MAGNWTPPRTWVDGETPGGSTFNTHVRDNLGYLKDSPTFDGNVSVSGIITVGGMTISSITTTTINASGLLTAGSANLGSLVVTGNMAVSGSMSLGDAVADIITVNGTVVGAPLKNYTETFTALAIAGGILTVDCNLGTYFHVSLNQNCSVSIVNNLATDRVTTVTILFIGDGAQRSVGWPNVIWPGGVAPVMSAGSNKRDLISLVNYGGGQWYGVICGQNY